MSGLNQLTARRLYDYRAQNGPFSSREQLKEVPGFGEAAFVQAAGFLKIAGGDNPLDATWIHPESYAAGRAGARASSECTRGRPGRKGNRRAACRAGRRSCSSKRLAAQLDAGALLLNDILAQLARPGRDPREDLPPPIFKKGVLKLDDLTPGMELTGTVLNVVDFGAFVDIGLKDSGLVHISQLANKYVRDPHEVVSVGDIVKVWVLEIDKTRRRVSLTMIPPGSERTPPRRKKDRRDKPDGEGGPAQAAEGTAEGGAAQPASHSNERRPGPPQRRPQRSGQGQGGQGSRRPPRHHEGQDSRPPKPKFRAGGKKPAPVVPLTEEMKTGKAPLRTFGDLKQFIKLKDEPEGSPPESES